MSGVVHSGEVDSSSDEDTPVAPPTTDAAPREASPIPSAGSDSDDDVAVPAQRHALLAALPPAQSVAHRVLRTANERTRNALAACTSHAREGPTAAVRNVSAQLGRTLHTAQRAGDDSHSFMKDLKRVEEQLRELRSWAPVAPPA